MLGAFATAFHAVQPAVVPGFALAWLELISHRAFMPALLNSKPAQKGWMLMHRLLIDLFVFMEPLAPSPNCSWCSGCACASLVVASLSFKCTPST